MAELPVLKLGTGKLGQSVLGQSRERAYFVKIYDTSGNKVAEFTSGIQNSILTGCEFELLQQGGCGAFSFTFGKPYTAATIGYDYRVEICAFAQDILYFTGKIIQKPKKGTEKPQTYEGYGYFNELEKKIIDTEISPGSDIAVGVTSILDTFITPYTSIVKDATLIETVNHDLVATIDFEDEYAKEVFKRLSELAVDYKFGVNEDRKFYFQAIDTSIQYYWHVGKHLAEFLPEEDPSDLAKKIIAVYPEVFSDGYRLKITSEADDYAGLYDRRFSLPEVVNPFSTTDLASGITPTTNPVAGTPANMTDGDYSTLWESGTNQASGHYIIVDLGEDKENIAAIVIDSSHENATSYNAKSIKIEIKPNGGSYATMLSSDDSIGWNPTITFRPTTGRYVKISLTGSSDEEWKVGGIGIYQLDLTDAQRWTDWKLSTLENVKKRATAKFAGVDRYILKQPTLAPIKPSGKARIFDEDGTKIDDYQVRACHYSLSSDGFHLDKIELGEEERTTADEMKGMERRIRENENSGVRRAKNLSLSKGFQLSQIKGTYIGEAEIETKHFRALSVLAGKIEVAITDNITDGKTAYDGTVLYRSTGAPTNAPAPSGITKTTKANGTMDIKLDWTAYTQGAKQADAIMLFWKKGTAALGAPTVNDSCTTFNVNTAAASYFIFEGVNPNDNWSFGIAAVRRTENGYEVGAIQSPTAAPDWQDVTEGTANYTANLDGETAANVHTWADDPAARVNTESTLILPGKLFLSWESGKIVIGQDALGTDKPGFRVNDGTHDRIDLGKQNGDYGATFRDADGVVWLKLGKSQRTWQEVYDEYLGQDATEVSISGLNGDVDQVYYIVCTMIGAVDAYYGYYMRLNNDSGNNYGRGYIVLQADATLSHGHFAGISTWYMGASGKDAADHAIGDVSTTRQIVEAKTGKVRSAMGYTAFGIRANACARVSTLGQAYSNTGTNITSIQIGTTQNLGMKAGSHLQIYKIPVYT